MPLPYFRDTSSTACSTRSQPRANSSGGMLSAGVGRMQLKGRLVDRHDAELDHPVADLLRDLPSRLLRVPVLDELRCTCTRRSTRTSPTISYRSYIAQTNPSRRAMPPGQLMAASFGDIGDPG
jgi:hypothetical protein